MDLTNPAPPVGTQDHAARSGTVADGDARAAPTRVAPNLADLLGLTGLWSGEACPAPTPSGVEHVRTSPPWAETPGDARLCLMLEQQFQALHRRLDALEHHAADTMFLVLSGQALVLGARREFSARSRAVTAAVVASPPFAGRCPACGVTPVLTSEGKPVAGEAEFDHVFHCGLNRPEHGWLICRPCHGTLHQGSYLTRFAWLPRFRVFQATVLEHRRARAGCTRAERAGTEA